MAQIVVDSNVLRDKAQTLDTAATNIANLYNEMLQEVNSTAARMKGTTIETQQKQFALLQPTFETFVKDMKAYAAFLTEAAGSYESIEQNGTQQAQEQGKVF